MQNSFQNWISLFQPCPFFQPGYEVVHEIEGGHTVNDIMINGDGEMEDIPLLDGPPDKWRAFC
jgi:hypothetical protein